MIRRVTSHQLVSIVLKHKKNDRIELSATQIFRTEQHLTIHAMDTYLGRTSFLELQEDFPDHVKLLPNSVEIVKAKELSKKLEHELRFARDSKVEEYIWKSWQSKK